MFDYTERLIKKLTDSSYSEEYINLCAQYSNRLLTNGLPVIFDKRHLAALIGLNELYLNHLFILTDKLYREIQIPKKRKGFRTISIPSEGIKLVQRWILDNILYKIRINQASQGFVKGRSIVDNAKVHVNKACIINIDIKDFFPSISIEQIFKLFYYYGYTKEISYLFAKLCTSKNKLPQGAPTSPYLTNIICKRLDKRINNLCSNIDAQYTRYADDITISSDSTDLSKYLHLIELILKDEGFKVNKSKTRVQLSKNRQVVTGLVVNKKLSVPNETKRYLRQQIYFCKTYGVTDHLKRTNNTHSNFKEHLYGVAFFIKMVEEDIGKRFLDDLNSISWENSFTVEDTKA